jgi:probable O-glycosylation ligase (exosortase A-associated)
VIYYGLLAFFALEYIRPGSYVPAFNALHLNTLVPLVICVKTFFGASPVSNQEALADRNTKRIGLLILLILISVFTADVTEFAYNKFIAVIGYVLIFWVINKQIVELNQLKGMFKALVLVHVVVAALTPEMFTSGERTYVATGSFLGDGNDFALSVNVAIPLCLFLLTNETKIRQKIFWGLALLFLVFAVVATQSRGGTLAVVAVGIYYWAKSNRKGIMAAMAVVAVLLVFALAPSGYFERMQDVANPEEGSAQGRIQAWSAGLRMVADHPLLGVGAGHFGVAYGSKYGKKGAPWQTAHSIYFLMIGELGIPGITALLWCIFGNLLENRKVLRQVRARSPGDSMVNAQVLASTSAAMIAFAVGGAFLSAVYYPHIYMVAALMTASRRIALRQSAAVTATASAAVPAREVSVHWALQRPPRPRLAGSQPNGTGVGDRRGGPSAGTGALKPV